jgi:hypothetical protein
MNQKYGFYKVNVNIKIFGQPGKSAGVHKILEYFLLKKIISG